MQVSLEPGTVTSSFRDNKTEVGEYNIRPPAYEVQFLSYG